MPVTRVASLCSPIMMLTENRPVGFRAAILWVSHVAAATLAVLVTIAPTRATPAPPQSGSSSIAIQSAREGLTLLVEDPSSAVIPDAIVSLVDAKTGQRWNLKTGPNGGLALPDLPPGSYELTLTASGFSRLAEKNLIVPSRAVVKLQVSRSSGIAIGTRPDIETTPSEIPAVLVEPRSSGTEVPLKPSDRRNALQRFFSKLHRVF